MTQKCDVTKPCPLNPCVCVSVRGCVTLCFSPSLSVCCFLLSPSSPSSSLSPLFSSSVCFLSGVSADPKPNCFWCSGLLKTHTHTSRNKAVSLIVSLVSQSDVCRILTLLLKIQKRHKIFIAEYFFNILNMLWEGWGVVKCIADRASWSSYRNQQEQAAFWKCPTKKTPLPLFMPLSVATFHNISYLYLSNKYIYCIYNSVKCHMITYKIPFTDSLCHSCTTSSLIALAVHLPSLMEDSGHVQ